MSEKFASRHRLFADVPNGVANRTSWPWMDTNESYSARYAPQSGGRALKISVVTPNYNGVQFIEEAMRSVLLQGYPELEYIIIDGGSSDGSVEIIKNYEPWLHYWVSEPDSGQAQAINKGLARCTGEIVAFLNSDDMYLPGAFDLVADLFASSPDVMWVCGACDVTNQSTGYRQRWEPRLSSRVSEFILGSPAAQPATFLNATVIRRLGLLDEEMHYSFDHEYWVRMADAEFRPTLTDAALAMFRLHPLSKTCNADAQFIPEDIEIARRYLGKLQPGERRNIIRWIARSERALVREQCRKKGQGNGIVARLQLIRSILHRPDLMSERATWGALKRPYR
jgi:glycosyltransferase involved in cell wall biosynthesis